MKKAAFVIAIIFVILLSIYLIKRFVIGGGPSVDQGPDTGKGQDEVAYNSTKDLSIQELNLLDRKKRAKTRFPGDTLDLMEYVIRNYPQGTYLLDFDRTTSYNVPQSAVIYSKQGDGTYVFAMIAKSKKDDPRLIEQKNVIGYDASYIDLDSTELGTAFFFLSLFKYDGGTFRQIWEAPVPSHGGFNKITMENWAAEKVPYIKANFHYAQGSGHIDYNYFLINGLLSPPHILMTYEGINLKRTMVDLNKDKYPDYCEYVYYDSGLRAVSPDSVFFIYRLKDSVYVNTRNPRQTRRYNAIGQEYISWR